MLEGAHWVHHDAPDRVTALLLAHLAIESPESAKTVLDAPTQCDPGTR